MTDGSFWNDDSALRREVRDFVEHARADGRMTGTIDSWMCGWDPDFSRALGERGWIGMTWPTRYGGRSGSALERFVVIEELLAAGAPVAAHWFADRQVGPTLLRFGTEAQRVDFLPRIAAGQCYFAIGLSEPDAGSDLAAVRTRAEPVDGGYRVSGTKIWTSGAHRCHYAVVLCRSHGERHDGLSQLIIALDAPGVSVRPILTADGEHHFNEVHFDDVFVGDDRVIGAPGHGWSQVNAELAFERSGPERFMSTSLLVEAFARQVRADPGERVSEALGDLFARAWTVRRMSVTVAATLDSGQAPDVEAALVKDVGTAFEQDSVEEIRRVLHPDRLPPQMRELLAAATNRSPMFTLRGGTSEILRTIVSRDLTR